MNNPSNFTAKQKILITHPWFLPAYKAGGPIQSLANLCRELKEEYLFYIVCTDKDHMDDYPLRSIRQNEWNDFEDGTAQVYYLSAEKATYKTILHLTKRLDPDIIFINGLFSPLFTLAPLLLKSGKKILSARGMLHPGALSQKSLKKKIYLTFLKIIGIENKVIFHATDQKEAQYIIESFGEKTRVKIAQNFPNKLNSDFFVSSFNGVLKIVSIALISPMKNHAIVLHALKNISTPVVYDIYGPIKDVEYWNSCIEIIADLPENIKVSYKGSIDPSMVSTILKNYQYLVQPSKSENFGHSIYEALSCGLPVITSHNTPWNNLESNKAGWNVDINDESSMTQVLLKAISINKDEYTEWSRSASQFARKQIDLLKIKNQYQELFQ